MDRPAVLIVSPDAAAYVPLLGELSEQGTQIAAATDGAAARSAWSGQSVLLGQPDIVSEVLGEMPGVRWVQSTWAGVSPLLELERRDFLLTGVRETFGPQMAEYVLGYLLARELKLEQRRRRQDRREWWPADSGTLHGKSLGIMGTGSIGRHIAKMAALFGLRITGYSRSGAPVAEFEQVFPAGRLAEFLAGPDYLVCVLPDTPATRHLLNEDAFRCMRPECYLVNVGRGSLIDEAALADALHRGDLAGAVLDVFGQEPLPSLSPLWQAPGLTVTAHVAARSMPREIARIFIGNYNRFVAGEALQFRIDFIRGY